MTTPRFDGLFARYIGLEKGARDALNLVDRNLRARLTLIRILADPGASSRIYTDKCPGGRNVSQAVARDVYQLLQAEDDAYSGFNPQLASTDEKRSEVLRAMEAGSRIREAIQNIFQAQWALADTTAFVSLPMPVVSGAAYRNRGDRQFRFGDDVLFVALEVRRSVLDRHRIIDQSVNAVSPRRPESFVHALIEVVVSECENTLVRGEMSFDRGPADLVRSAGVRLTLVAANSAGRVWSSTTQTPLEAIAAVSGWRHEGNEVGGRLLIVSDNDERNALRVRFDRAVPLNESRSVRKLLEMTREGNMLLSDGLSVYGIAAPSANLDKLFSVEFLGQFDWVLSYGSLPVLRVESNEARLPKRALDVDRLRHALQREFPSNDTGTILDLAESVSGAAHGALLVITSEASSEAIRLGSQGTPVRPLSPSPSDIRALAAIDGAVILDPTGVCHAVGVILDGIAVAEGTAGRGARYNSSIRYVESRYMARRERGCLAIVVSEDRTVDFVPQYSSPVARETIDDALREIEESCDLAGRPIDSFRLRYAYSDILEIGDQLTQDDCDRVNACLENARADGITSDPFLELGEFVRFVAKEEA